MRSTARSKGRPDGLATRVYDQDREGLDIKINSPPDTACCLRKEDDHGTTSGPLSPGATRTRTAIGTGTNLGVAHQATKGLETVTFSFAKVARSTEAPSVRVHTGCEVTDSVLTRGANLE
jgi:hypothetical protein